MNRTWNIPRRTFLRGFGTAIALPLLEAMAAPAKLIAANAMTKSAPPLPQRIAFVYVPNGMNMADWTPKNTGTNFDLPPILEPLQAHQKEFSIISGLALNGARALGDGPGDHARANASFLTGCHPHKTPGADIKAGVSVDQIAAAQIGRKTRLSSLQLACATNKMAGMCDSGYSCAYQSNVSWKTASTPMPAEVDPRLVFERLFGNHRTAETKESQERRRRQQKSILDFVLEDARQLQGKLGTTDRHKVDEYLTAVRELEQRIEQAEKFSGKLPGFNRPTGIPNGPDGFEKHIRLMYDLMALAFQTDTTRICTFMVAYDGNNRPYKHIGVPEGHHDLSHHANDPAKKEKIAKINRFHTTQFASFLEKLKTTPEGNGTLLDHCMIVYGSGIGDGNAHNHDKLPILLAGRGGGTLSPGRHLQLETETPLTNLYLSLLDNMGIPAERISDSTGKLAGI